MPGADRRRCAWTCDLRRRLRQRRAAAACARCLKADLPPHGRRRHHRAGQADRSGHAIRQRLGREPAVRGRRVRNCRMHPCGRAHPRLSPRHRRAAPHHQAPADHRRAARARRHLHLQPSFQFLPLHPQFPAGDDPGAAAARRLRHRTRHLLSRRCRAARQGHDVNRILATLRSGDWLTRDRMRLWALAILTASLAGLIFLVVTSDGLNDYQNRPLGTDFSDIYAGGTYVLDGHAALAFDPPSQHEREKAIFGPNTPFYGWCYPPFLLFVGAVVALVPYAMALLVWQLSTLLLYLGMLALVIRMAAGSSAPDMLRDRLWLLLALAFPAVFVNLGHGHNGFLTAALLGTALVVLNARPILAGILFGLLSYKPQFGVMIPLVLVATARWRTFASAAGTVALLALVSTLVFGAD